MWVVRQTKQLVCPVPVPYWPVGIQQISFKKREKKIIINFVVGKLVRIDISVPFNRAKLPVQ